MRDSVMVHMAAPAGQVWDLVSDITRIGEFSPETFEAQWLPGPSEHGTSEHGSSEHGTGARFRGHVRRNGRGPVYWTTCTVVASEPGREFGFTVALPGGKKVITWRYRIEPRADGSDVTESFELADTLLNRVYWALAGHARRRTNLNGMRTTLERIKAVTETAAGTSLNARAVCGQVRLRRIPSELAATPHRGPGHQCALALLPRRGTSAALRSHGAFAAADNRSRHAGWRRKGRPRFVPRTRRASGR
jgi:hypothetical protein